MKAPPLSSFGRSLFSASHTSYLRRLASAQAALTDRIESTVPSARVRWHYRLVADGVSVVLPASEVAQLRSVPGVAEVWPNVTYHALTGSSGVQQIGADQLWGSDFATAGNGMKIGIIDDGLDAQNPYFDANGFQYPAGFPKGQTKYTTPKVIVQRTFAPPSSGYKDANLPFDPLQSFHATHVAGIAAGDYGTAAGSQRISGVAPNAYLGNYKALTTPTPGFGLDGNSAEIAAAIEAAVADGMNVINLSLGEPEVEPSRDLVVKAIEGAAAAGVIPVIAAGNDYDDFGLGSISSPGNAPDAITVAAATSAGQIADFSSAGPTPVSLGMKPDVTAPGVDVLSSLPPSQGTFGLLSGTSMASPHVAGAAAVLKQRHPTWTPAQIKSALTTTGDPVRPATGGGEISATREGGGRIYLPRADAPLVFVSPTSLSFGLVGRGETQSRQIAVTDAGGGPAAWTASLSVQSSLKGATPVLSAPTIVPGTSLGVSLNVAADAAEGDGVGFVTLTRGTDVRRIPYWFHVEAPRLGEEAHRTLVKPGVYRGDTAGKQALVSTYRYPEQGLACNCKTGVPLNLSGPEQVFRVTLEKNVANFGVAVLSHANGVTVAPRLVQAGDENRLVGFTGLPVDINPYRGYGRVVPVVGAILPKPGAYDIVFDTPAAAKPGAFTFRFWVNDSTPPRVRALRPVAGAIRLAITDTGSGVDIKSTTIRVDGAIRSYTFARNVLTVRGLARGVHRVALSVGDFQETKNMEDVGPVLPNTRAFSARITVR